MKTIIAGSRDFSDYDFLKRVILESGFKITSVISGKARGVDTMGERYAKEMGLTIIEKPADWNKYGKRAGYLRNEEMAKIADALIAIRINKSKGTGHMIDLANKYGLKVFVKEL